MASPEYLLQVAVVKHLESAFPHIGFFHVPNQTRDATEAYFNKLMGVKPGVSDIVFGWLGNAGVIELKSEHGKLSNAQNRFLSWADSIGWKTGTAKTVRGVHNILCSWGLEPHHHTCQEPDYRPPEQKRTDAYNFFAPHK